MKLKCKNKRCKYEWDYQGAHQFYATCPRCLQKVKLKFKDKKMEKQLERIANELVIKAKMMEKMPRLAEDDEHNEILQNIAIDEAIQEEQEMYDYLNR